MKTEKLLIIDENPHFNDSARRFLAGRKELKAVETVSGAEEALSSIGLFKPSLVLISDSMLKNSKELRALFARLSTEEPGIKVIRLTLYSAAPDEEGLVNAEAGYEVIAKDDFASKMIDLLKNNRRDGYES